MHWPVKLAAGGLTVRFDRTGDRISHSILIGESEVPLLDSLEGESDEAWPPSPPFQELTLETRGDRQLALLVGKAGTSHWSASVDPQRDQILFDIACRIQFPPEWLGSRMTVDFRDGSLEVVASTELELSSEHRIRNNCIEIFPRVAITRLPATVRWRYVIKRLPPSTVAP